jgi:hypothetical protein
MEEDFAEDIKHLQKTVAEFWSRHRAKLGEGRTEQHRQSALARTSLEEGFAHLERAITPSADNPWESY